MPDEPLDPIPDGVTCRDPEEHFPRPGFFCQQPPEENAADYDPERGAGGSDGR